jgi:L-methionine (R)-S-oxide reductase
VPDERVPGRRGGDIDDRRDGTMNEAELAAELIASSSAPVERGQRAARVAATVRRFGGYRWVGVYDVTVDEIAVVGWDGVGPPAHPRFPRSQGLCGAAVAAGETVIVDDVAADPRYLTTHTTTRSEIVVPVFSGDHIVGLIDVESERPDAFGERDRQLLERCAAVIVPLWRTRRRLRQIGSGSPPYRRGR